MTTVTSDRANRAMVDLRDNVQRLADGERSADDTRRARDRSIVQAHRSGVTTAAIAAECGISGAMVRRIVQIARESGDGATL